MRIVAVLTAGAVFAHGALHLGVGINLGNVLEAPVEGAWAPPAQEYYFDDYVSAGFQSVRIPVRWDNHTMTSAPYTINATWLARVTEVVQWSLSRGLTTIINSHWDTWLDNATSFETQLPRFAAIWTQVAAHFASAPATLAFECFNEPHLMSVAQLNDMFATFYSVARASNPQRWLLFGGLQYDSPDWIVQNPNASRMVIPGAGSDPAVALEIHDYDPYAFCSPHPTITNWGSPADVAVVNGIYGNMSLWSAAHGGVPVALGEFGCARQQPNATARALWYATSAAAVRAAGAAFAGFTVWDDDGSYAVYNRSTRAWDEPVLRALGLRRRQATA